MVDSFLAVVLGFSTILLGLTALYFYRDANNKNKQSEFEEFSKKLNASNKEEIDKTWKPYKEQLQRDLDILKASIEQQKAIAIKNSERFDSKIEDLLNATSGMQEDAQNLTKALKGDTKQQGDWGEQILKKALEDAGLVEGLEYELQPSYKGKDGDQLRPDAVIKLSDGRNIIIDSKVSLTAYERYVRSDNDDDKKNSLKEHINSIKNHVKQLSDKGYADIEEIGSPDFIFIFVPIDSALSLALSHDWNVQELANKNKIAFMTPIHLISILKMTAYMWRVDKQQKHAEEVANRAGLLLDKYSNFSEAFSNIAEKLQDAMASYEIAHNRLTEGKGSLHTQMELLEEAGMKGKKSISLITSASPVIWILFEERQVTP